MHSRLVLILLFILAVSACNRSQSSGNEDQTPANPLRDYITVPKDKAKLSGQAVEDHERRIDAVARELDEGR